MLTAAGRLGAAVILVATASTPIAFSEPSVEERPPAVVDWLRANRSGAATGVVHDGASTYLVASAGERRSGGYRLRFTEVALTNDGIVATVTLSSPRPGSPVTQVLSYPTAVARIERTERPVVFRWSERVESQPAP